MITLAQYLMGRDEQYPADFTPTIRAQAVETVDRVNRLLAKFAAAVPGAALRTVTSGWRPAAKNATTPGAAPASQHVQARACDLSDADGALDAWLMTAVGQLALGECGLWHEHPRDTPGWAHVQTRPPGSGRRTFYAK